MNDTENLQEPKKEWTAKEWAKHLRISERQMYKASTVMRLRPDLMEKVAAREIKLHAAYREARGESKPTSWDRLVTAWNNATPDDRARFMEELGFRYEAMKMREKIAICLPDSTANLQNGAKAGSP